jgi:AmmeMemoRadiSam system protein A
MPPLSPQQRAGLLKLARETLRRKLSAGEDPSASLSTDPDLNLPSAVFVTLRLKGAPRESSLRGCIGSLVPDLPLADAVRLHALQSALEDPRFPPVQAAELDGLSIEISRLSPMRPVKSHLEVHPGQGVTVEKDGRGGVFLPQVWEDIPDKTAFLEELCSQKAGLPRDCWKDPKTNIRVFDAEPFEEN